MAALFSAPGHGGLGAEGEVVSSELARLDKGMRKCVSKLGIRI